MTYELEGEGERRLEDKGVEEREDHHPEDGRAQKPAQVEVLASLSQQGRQSEAHEDRGCAQQRRHQNGCTGDRGARERRSWECMECGTKRYDAIHAPKYRVKRVSVNALPGSVRSVIAMILPMERPLKKPNASRATLRCVVTAPLVAER